MDEETLELQDSSQPDVDTEVSEEVVFQDTEEQTDEVQPDEAELLKQQLEAEKKKNAQLYARIKKQEPKKEINNDSSPFEERLERQDLRIEGYSPEEVDFIMQNGGKDAVKKPLVKAAIESIRAERKSKEATPTGGNKSPVFRNYSKSELENMPLEEFEKLLRKAS